MGRIIDLEEQMKSEHQDLKHFITQYSKYDIDWLFRQPIWDFWAYIRRIERDLKQQSKR